MATVLLVDDSRSIRQIVSAALRGAGHQVSEAENGQQGVEIAATNSFDLIITDLNMPVMNGLEMTRQIRSLPGKQATRILLVTTDSQMEKKEEARAAGASGWVVKPIPPERLLEVVSTVLEKSVRP